MAQNVFGFFEKLQTTILNCQATLHNSRPMELTAGFDWASMKLRDVQQCGQKVILIGNGENAATASQLSIVLCRSLKIKALTFNEPTLMTCLANDYGFEELFSKAVAPHLEKDDLLIALSSLGKDDNIVNAAIETKKKESAVITFSGLDPQNRLYQLGDLNFLIPSSLTEVVNSAHPILLNCIVDRYIQLYPEETIETTKVHETNELESTQLPLY